MIDALTIQQSRARGRSRRRYPQGSGDEALRRCWRERDVEAQPLFRATEQQSALNPSARLNRLIFELADDAHDTPARILAGEPVNQLAERRVNRGRPGPRVRLFHVQ